MSITESTKESLLVPATSTGLQAMIAVFDQDVTALCRPDSKHNADRTGSRAPTRRSGGATCAPR